MRTRRFGREIKLPSTIAIKHQIRKLMFEDAVKKAEAVGDIAFTSDTLEHAALRFSALRSRAPAEYEATSNRRKW